MKESSGTPPIAVGSCTPASGAPTVNKKVKEVGRKHAIFEQVFNEKGNPKALGQPSVGPSEQQLADRDEAYNRAREYVKKAAPLPLKLEDVTVESLGSIMVEKVADPAFHNSLRLWPIGYRATYQDPITSTRYLCEILDGMDTKMRKNAPAFSVRIMAKPEHQAIEGSVYAAWKNIMEWQIAHGSPADQEAAKQWDVKCLGDRFGLSNKEIRKRLEGLPGAKECMRYQFMGTKTVPNNRANGGGEEKGKNPESKKKKQKMDTSASDENAKTGKPGNPRGFYVFQAEIKEQVKAELQASGDKNLSGSVNKIISSRWSALSEDAKKGYQARAEAKKPTGSLEPNDSAADPMPIDPEPEPEPEQDPDDTSAYRTDGPYVGERARRFIFNDKEQPIDVADGVIFGYLSVEDQGDDVYISEETNLPAALWRIKFDDTAFGTEDLEECEVKEAIALLNEPLSEKLQVKHEKRLEKLAQKKAKIAERQAERDRLRQEKEAERERLKHEKERLRMDKDKSKGSSGLVSCLLQGAVSSTLLDESSKIICSGPYRGQKAGAVPFPHGAVNAFPGEHSADFLALYAFLRDLSGPLGAVRMSFEELRNCFIEESATVDSALSGKVSLDVDMAEAEQDDDSKKAIMEEEGGQGGAEEQNSSQEISSLEAFCELSVWLTKLAVRSKHIKEEEDSVEYDARRVLAGNDLPSTVGIKLSPGPLLSPAMKDSETISYSCWHLVNETSWPEMAKLLIKSCPFFEDYCDLLKALDTQDPKDFSLETKFSLLNFLRDEVCACDKVRKIINSKLKEADRIQDRKRIEDAALRKSRDLQKSKQRADPELCSAEAGGSKLKPMGAFEIMRNLHHRDPQPFEFKHHGQVYKSTMDTSGLVPKLKCDGQAFDSPMQWLTYVCKKDKLPGMATKAVISYKGKTLRDWESSLVMSSSPKSSTELVEPTTAEDEKSISVDAERRKREFEAAMLRAERGLRLECVGQDRHFRKYWCFDGISDQVWVGPAERSLSDGPNAPVNFGYDGSRTKEFAALRRINEESWACFSLSDGTLQALYEYLANGPMGVRESLLLEQLRNLKIRGGFSGGEIEGKPESGGSEPQAADSEDGYNWKQLPHIGDVVWARKGSDPKTAVWYPVLVVDPEEEEAPVCNDDDLSDDEWQRSGSDYLGKRVLLSIFDKRKNKKVMERGKIVGWLPVDVADFKSEVTGENAALWRVKLDDKAYSSQDLEEYEVKEAIKAFMKEEAVKKGKDSEYLSRKSMFGQTVKWLHGQFMDDREVIERFAIKDVLPYVEFREERIQEMRRANKAKLLQQVERANQYLEEHSTSQDKEEDLKEILRELGLSIKAEQKTSPEFQASCRHCMRHPRIMTVIQRNLDNTPLVGTVRELREQLLAIYKKLEAQITFLEDEAVINKFDTWAEAAKSATRLSDVSTALTTLESLLGDLAHGSVEEASFVADEDDKWRTEGHEWIGKRLRRPVQGQLGQTIGYVKAKVVGWLPAEESDFVDESKSPAPLWHVLWEDGDEEDLEDFEVRDGMRSLVESGDSPDLSGQHGVWDSPRDRDCWLKLVAGARTVGAVALALYLLGDRALHFVAVFTKEARLAQEEWDDHCYISGEGGSLVCCESCPRTALPASLGLARAPKGDYFCAYCVREQNRRARRSGAAPASAPAERAAQRGGSAGSKSKKQGAKGGARGGDAVERMRKNIVKHGVHDGSVCEVAAEAQSAKRDGRCFVKVLDGHVDKSTDDPAIKSCHYFTEWRASEGRRMQLGRKKGPVPVRLILQVGATADLLEGDHRAGFVPCDGR